ncbi:hypothetical protein ACLB2K_007047 [Fragaria x ananassa]
MLPSDQRVRAQAPLPHLKVRGWRPAGTLGCATSSLRAFPAAPRWTSGGPPATLLGSKLIKFECRCLGMLPSEERVRAQAPLPHLKV